MINVLEINGFKTVVSFDPDTNLFRGEFVGLNGGADFYADTVEGLKKEGEASLKVFLQVCKEKGIDPVKAKSGKFVLRLRPDIHEKMVIASRANGVSLNEWANKTLEKALL